MSSAAPAPPPPPPGLDIHASRQPELYAATLTTWVLGVIAVVLRFWCRHLTSSGFKADDWLIVVAMFLSLGLLISTVVWIHQGYGLHLWVLGPEFIPHFFKNLFVGEILYTLIICFVKFSILSFYRRIFAATINLSVYILGIIVTAWGVAVVLVTIFQCSPVSGFWDKTKPSKCSINNYAFFIGIAVPNIVTDAAMLLLPLPFIFRLHRPNAQRIALAGIFMLGGFVLIISIVRLVVLVTTDLKSPDLDWNFSYVGIWTLTEANMAITCACLPSLRPVLTVLMTGSVRESRYNRGSSDNRYISNPFKRKRLDESSSGSGAPDTNRSDSQYRFVPLPEETGRENSFAAGMESQSRGTKASRGYGQAFEMQSDSHAQRGIHVQSDTSVDWTPRRQIVNFAKDGDFERLELT